MDNTNAQVPPANETQQATEQQDQAQQAQAQTTDPVGATQAQTAAPPAAQPPQQQATQPTQQNQEQAQQTQQANTSLLGDLLGGDQQQTQDQNDYNYDYDDIQLENGVIGTEGDKALVNSIAKELGLSRDQARKLYQNGGALVKAQQQQQRNAMIQQWNAQIQADPEVGGANLEGAKANFRRALDTFGSPELRTLLTQNPIYQVPEVFKFFAKAGKAISSDNEFAKGNGGAPNQLSDKERFLKQFPNSGYIFDDNFNK